MEHYSATAVERAMKVHEVIMRAMSDEIAWFSSGGDHWLQSAADAALEESLGVSYDNRVLQVQKTKWRYNACQSQSDGLRTS